MNELELVELVNGIKNVKNIFLVMTKFWAVDNLVIDKITPNLDIVCCKIKTIATANPDKWKLQSNYVLLCHIPQTPTSDGISFHILSSSIIEEVAARLQYQLGDELTDKECDEIIKKFNALSLVSNKLLIDKKILNLNI